MAGEEGVRIGAHQRMDDPLQPLQRLGLAEHPLRQPRAIHHAVDGGSGKRRLDERRRLATRPKVGTEQRPAGPARQGQAAEAPRRTRAEVKAETAQVLSTGVQQLVVTQDENEMRIDRFLEARFPQLSFSHIQRIVRKGELRVDGKRADSKAARKGPAAGAGDDREGALP